MFYQELAQLAFRRWIYFGERDTGAALSVLCTAGRCCILWHGSANVCYLVTDEFAYRHVIGHWW